jgi:multicomponent Na+:H+ antiporter subunit B
MRYAALLICFVTGGILLSASKDFPEWNNANTLPNTYLSVDYAMMAQDVAKTPNIVTVTLGDYRGYDTMFETCVIFCAGMAVLLLLRTPKSADAAMPHKVAHLRATHDEDLVMRTSARLLLPWAQLFALYVLFFGHHSPGGGFQAGTILGAGVILVSLAFHLKVSLTKLPERVMIALASLGTLIYVGTGVTCMVLGGEMLDYSALARLFPTDEIMARNIGIALIESGVCLAVMSVMALIYVTIASDGQHDEAL